MAQVTAFDGARELHQRAVAHELDDSTRMGGNRRVDQLTPQGIQSATEYPPHRGP